VLFSSSSPGKSTFSEVKRTLPYITFLTALLTSYRQSMETNSVSLSLPSPWSPNVQQCLYEPRELVVLHSIKQALLTDSLMDDVDVWARSTEYIID
jgi:hypothetical protein